MQVTKPATAATATSAKTILFISASFNMCAIESPSSAHARLSEYRPDSHRTRLFAAMFDHHTFQLSPSQQASLLMVLQSAEGHLLYFGVGCTGSGCPFDAGSGERRAYHGVGDTFV